MSYCPYCALVLSRRIRYEDILLPTEELPFGTG